MSLKQPITQVRLTNVAVVRYRVKGHRFELACYKNKVQSYRQGIEKDLDEVLQTAQIFSNVSKGVLANKADLTDAFATEDHTKIVKVILEKGEVQVSEKERTIEREAKFKDIANIISEKCINKDTQKPFPVPMIESAMKELHISVKMKKNAKQQALEIIKKLKAILNIERAQMRIHIECPIKEGKPLKAKLATLFAAVEEEEMNSNVYEVRARIDPGQYGALEALIQQNTKGKGKLQIVDLKVVEEGETSIDEEDRKGDEDEEEEDDDEDEEKEKDKEHVKDKENKEKEQEKDAVNELSEDLKKMSVDKKKKGKPGKAETTEEGVDEDVESEKRGKGKKGKKGKKEETQNTADSDDDSAATGKGKKKDVKKGGKKKGDDAEADAEDDNKSKAKSSKSAKSGKAQTAADDNEDSDDDSSRTKAKKSKSLKSKSGGKVDEESDDAPAPTVKDAAGKKGKQISTGYAQHTKFLMIDGTSKMACDLKVGDRLMGADGKVRTVDSVDFGQAKCYELKLGNRRMRLTGDHPIACMVKTRVGTLTVDNKKCLFYLRVAVLPKVAYLSMEEADEWSKDSAYAALKNYLKPTKRGTQPGQQVTTAYYDDVEKDANGKTALSRAEAALKQKFPNPEFFSITPLQYLSLDRHLQQLLCVSSPSRPLSFEQQGNATADADYATMGAATTTKDENAEMNGSTTAASFTPRRK